MLCVHEHKTLILRILMASYEMQGNLFRKFFDSDGVNLVELLA